jgi:hypothetical protein
VTIAAAAGAVNKPLDAIVPPPETDHVTAELKLPVPRTPAVHCEVAPGATVDGLQVAETEEIVGDAVCGAAALARLPQERSEGRAREASRAQTRVVFNGIPELRSYRTPGRDSSCLPDLSKKVTLVEAGRESSSISIGRGR